MHSMHTLLSFPLLNDVFVSLRGVSQLPQELGDFGILLHSGFSKKAALGLNLLTSFTNLLGVLIGRTALDA